MTGLVAVIEMLGNTITDLQTQLAEAIRRADMAEDFAARVGRTSDESADSAARVGRTSDESADSE